MKATDRVVAETKMNGPEVQKWLDVAVTVHGIEGVGSLLASVAARRAGRHARAGNTVDAANYGECAGALLAVQERLMDVGQS
jgi:hypothetical protein